MTDVVGFLIYLAIVLVFTFVIVKLLQARDKETSAVNQMMIDMIPTGTKVITDVVASIVKKFDKDPANDSVVDMLMKYATISVASMEQQYKTLKAELKKNGGDIIALNDSIKTKAVELAEKLATSDGKELAPDQKEMMPDIVEAALKFLFNK
ncbi:MULTISPECIES: hypothetical protein [unclassified Mesotoga]|uniref:hypothetical protein n=1 Tax=unclassified Mesotoga TaxID=1184398 RepID=UPI000DA67529|nr:MULTISPECIES: hypothetical protein [unclassified Mesotoga]PZC52297.1 hypothetical protein LH53_05635 [Mesotoga sp. TolDC]